LGADDDMDQYVSFFAQLRQHDAAVQQRESDQQRATQQKAEQEQIAAETQRILEERNKPPIHVKTPLEIAAERERERLELERKRAEAAALQAAHDAAEKARLEKEFQEREQKRRADEAAEQIRVAESKMYLVSAAACRELIVNGKLTFSLEFLNQPGKFMDERQIGFIHQAMLDSSHVQPHLLVKDDV
jgi:hypothetical protein